jgi:hypothetical protein
MAAQGGCMATIGISEAARLVARDVSTLHRMMKNGRVAYSVDSQGHRRLDPAELARVFEITPMHGNGAMQSSATPQAAHGDATEIIALLRDEVRDLRGRLDASEAERRKLSERLGGLLTARHVRRHRSGGQRWRFRLSPPNNH